MPTNSSNISGNAIIKVVYSGSISSHAHIRNETLSTVALLDICKGKLRNLQISVRDEDLSPTADLPTTTFESRHQNWQTFPTPEIRTIDDDGVETLLHATSGYSIDYVNGRITLTSPSNEVVRATYDYDPITDDDLLVDIIPSSTREIATAIFRTIDVGDIPEQYTEAICKRVYTNVLKRLVIEARDFYSVSIAGRSMDKNTIVTHFNDIIDQNEEQLKTELQALRYYNTSNRLE